MDNTAIEQMRKKVKAALSGDHMRYMHTLGVANTAACLAMRYRVDYEQAYIAGLLHDCAKCVPDKKKLEECAAFGIPVSLTEKKNPYLLHAKLGAAYAEKIYGITDPDVLNAICYHTTGRPAMTKLEEIIFLADYIEPYRNQAPDLSCIREEAFSDLDQAVLTVTTDTLAYLRKNIRSIDPLTEKTQAYYQEHYHKKEEEE